MPEAPFQGLAGNLDEGHILANVPFPVWRDVGWGLNPTRGIITSHGCACEDYYRAIAAGQASKARKIRLHVAPIRSLSGQPEDKVRLIQNGAVWQFFYVYGDGGATLPDQVVDLDSEHAIPAETLVRLPRITRLANWQWKKLLIHVTVNRWGRSADDIFGHDRAEELRTP